MKSSQTILEHRFSGNFSNTYFHNTEKVSVTDQHIEQFNGQPLKIIVNQCQGGWQSMVEVDLGRTGCIVFEDSTMTYPSEEEAREAAVTLAVQNLSRSRIGKGK